MDKFPENTGKQKKHRKEYITKRKLEFTLLPPVETRYSEEEIRQALMENYGSLNNTALELQASYHQIHTYFNETPERKAYLLECKKRIAELGERKLAALIESPDPRIALEATKFALSRIGKTAGWDDSPHLQIQQAIVATDKKVQIMNLFGIGDGNELSAV